MSASNKQKNKQRNQARYKAERIARQQKKLAAISAESTIEMDSAVQAPAEEESDFFGDLVYLSKKPVWNKVEFEFLMDRYAGIDLDVRDAFEKDLRLQPEFIDENGQNEFADFMDQADLILEAHQHYTNYEGKDYEEFADELGIDIAYGHVMDKFIWRDLKDSAFILSEEKAQKVTVITSQEALPVSIPADIPAVQNVQEAPAEAEVEFSGPSVSKTSASDIISSLMEQGEITGELQNENMQQTVRQVMTDMNHPDAKNGTVDAEKLSTFYKDMITAIESGNDMNQKLVLEDGKLSLPQSDAPEANPTIMSNTMKTGYVAGLRLAEFASKSSQNLRRTVVSKTMLGLAAAFLYFGFSGDKNPFSEQQKKESTAPKTEYLKKAQKSVTVAVKPEIAKPVGVTVAQSVSHAAKPDSGPIAQTEAEIDYETLLHAEALPADSVASKADSLSAFVENTADSSVVILKGVPKDSISHQSAIIPAADSLQAIKAEKENITGEGERKKTLLGKVVRPIVWTFQELKTALTSKEKLAREADIARHGPNILPVPSAKSVAAPIVQ